MRRTPGLPRVSGSAVRAEVVKVFGLRSTWALLLTANFVGLVIGVMTLHSVAASWFSLSSADRMGFDPTADALTGFQFTQLALGAWGALVATGEYAHGTISSTLTAVPRRGNVYVAKLVVLASVSAPLSLITVVATWTLGQTALRGQGLDASWDDPGVVRALVSATLVLTVVTVLGYGLGALLRHTALALSAMVAVLFLAWPAARAIESITYLPDRWLIANAADALVSTHPVTGPNALRTPTPGAAVLEIVVYLVVILGLGAWRFHRDPP